jgi:beta-lactamase regulating signal transducer with metallopeptidase domain
MTSSLIQLTETTLSLGLAYVLHSTLLLIGVAVFLLGLRATSHTLRERLWKLAVVVPLVTSPLQVWSGVASIPDGWSVSVVSAEAAVDAPRDEAPLALPGEASATVLETPFESVPSPLGGEGARRAGEGAAQAGIGVPTVASEAPSSGLRPPSPPRGEGTNFGRAVLLDSVAFGIALAVLASLSGGLLLLVVQRGRFWWRLRKCRVVEEGVTRSELDRLLCRKQIRRRVRLLVSDGFVEPVACGVLRWTIIVPHGVEQRLNREQIDGLLAHELAHLVRGDTAWLWVGNIVCSCLWFQPLNFLARRRWQQAAEFLSDEWAVADANVSPLSLAQCLTQIAEWRLDRRESGASLAAGGHRSTLSSRIDCLVQDERPHDAWKSRRRKRAVLLGVVAVGGALVWAVPRAEFVHADSPSRSGFHSDTSEVQKERPDPAEASSVHGNRATSSAEEPAVSPTEKLYPFDSPELWVKGRASQRTAGWQAEWNELQAELKGLNADLIRVAELLEKYPGDVRVRELAEQIRARAISFEVKRQSLDERLKAEQDSPQSGPVGRTPSSVRPDSEIESTSHRSVTDRP